jgi:hypothetical protein
MQTPTEFYSKPGQKRLGLLVYISMHLGEGMVWCSSIANIIPTVIKIENGTGHSTNLQPKDKKWGFEI